MRKAHVLFSIVSVFLLLGTGIGFYLHTSQRNNPSTDEALDITHAYEVTWKTTSVETSHMKGFAGKDSDYINTISFDQPNLKELRFTLNWTDDKATVLNRCGLDTLTLQITSPDGSTVQDSAKSAPRTKQGYVDIIVPLKTEDFKPLTLYSRDLSEASSQARNAYDDTWVNKHFTVRISVKVGEIRLLKRLQDQGNDFDLTITPLFSTAVITELGPGATITNNTQDSQSNTNETSAQLAAQIKGGPFEGYPPLTVHFLGNPTKDTRIVSYHWTFGPTSKLIAPESLYRNPHVSILLLCLMLFYVNPLLFITSISLYERYLTKSQSRYESTEQDPTMVFGSTGNYWATLTVTDTQGRTASDTMWITVLQYVYPDHDHTT
jgi:PKD repeat protein